MMFPIQLTIERLFLYKRRHLGEWLMTEVECERRSRAAYRIYRYLAGIIEATYIVAMGAQTFRVDLTPQFPCGRLGFFPRNDC